MTHLKARDRARVKRIVTALKRYDPQRVILFGSAVRGDGDAHSDLDIVVIKETADRFLDRAERVYDLVQPTFSLDALVYTPGEFAEMRARENPFVEQVLREGVVVYERAPETRQVSLVSATGGPEMRRAQVYAVDEARAALRLAEKRLRS